VSAMRKHPLRRIVLSLAGTVSGVVLLLALKPHTPPVQTAAPAESVTASPSASEASPSGKESPSHSKSPSPSATKTSKRPSATASKAPSPTRTTSKPAAKPTQKTQTTRTVTGSTVQTKYGPVQVRITLSGDRITAASAVQSPSETPRSKEISDSAIPVLNQRTVAAQSANIDAVSGATYTSQGYVTSLQSALDSAGV
jgi:uncharacterized protein with FMN-binding domain